MVARAQATDGASRFASRALSPGHLVRILFNHWTMEQAMNHPEKVMYTARVHTTGGRAGEARSDDGHLYVKLSRPGTSTGGTKPEQLFAAGWSACFESAMEVAAHQLKIALPKDYAIDAEVDLGPNEMHMTLRPVSTSACRARSQRWRTACSSWLITSAHTPARRKAISRFPSTLCQPTVPRRIR